MRPAEKLSDFWRLSPDTFAEYASHGSWTAHRHLRYVAEKITPAIINGGGRFIIEMPPRHGKSEFVSHWVPTWFLNLWPEKKVIIAAYSDTLAKFFGRQVRNEFETNDLLWTRLSSDKSAAADFATDRGGGLITAGIGGPITGRGGQLIIIDDPIKNAEEAHSATVHENQKMWFNSTLYTRQEPRATIIVVMTRWHEDDLAGWLLREHSDPWTEIRLPAIAEGDDPLGRKEGDALFPERFTAERLDEIRQAVGSWAWAGMYQQRPSPIEGGIWKREYWRRYRETPPFHYVFQSWDTNIVAGGSSFAVGMVLGVYNADIYLLDVVRGKWGFNDLVSEFEKLSAKWPTAYCKLVENKANGPAMHEVLRHKIPGIVLVEPEGGKEIRAMAAEPMLRAGNVYIPAPELNILWVEPFIAECANFPNAENDDQVDTMSQGIAYVMRKRGTMLRLGVSEDRSTIVGDARRQQF